MGIYGQDWASYQSATPNTSGLSFAFVKVTEGTGYVNPLWARQRDHAKANGLVWGGYHYPHMGNSPQAEADYFLSRVAWQPGDVIILDWEGYDSANAGVSRPAQLAYKEAWLRYVKGRMPHNPVGMYCNTDYWTNVDTTGYYGDFLWIATAGLPTGQPGIRANWLFHQYSDSPVDSDFCHLGSAADLHTWALSFAQPATPPAPPEDIVTPQDINAVAAAVWSYQIPRAATADSPALMVPAWSPLAWNAHDQQALAGAISTRIAALEATVGVLATAVGKAQPGVDTATLVAAVDAAIAAAVVHVDVNVTGTPTAPTT